MNKRRTYERGFHELKKGVTLKDELMTWENPKGHRGATVVCIWTLMKTLIDIEGLFFLWKCWLTMIILCLVILLSKKMMIG